MSISELVFGSKVRAQVGFVQFDCMLSETHSDEATVTDHPVEEGANISDHIRKGPASLELNGIVTNTPIVYLASLQAISPIEGDLTPVQDRAELAYAELRRIMEDGETVDVVTSFRNYENMALTGMSVTRDAATGQVLNCSLSLREITVAVTQTVKAPAPDSTANNKPVNKGKKVKSPATPKQSESALHWISKGVAP
jgi:hypothetical protein